MVTTARLRAQRGASLVLALVMILVLAVILSAVLAYANTSIRTSETYRRERVQRYAGDAALETAINYVRGEGLMGRDPDYTNTDPPCVYNVLTDAYGDDEPVTVTCAADPGSNSGVPRETGKVPDQAILATGQRHNEPGPLNQTNCAGSWFGTPFFSLQNAEPESSILFRQGEIRDYFEEASLLPCESRNRAIDPFVVRGDVVAAGRGAGTGSVILSDRVENGTVVPSQFKAEYGCRIAISPSNCGNPTPAEYQDPALSDPVGWQALNIDWTPRTTAYRWTGSGLVSTSTCSPRDTIIFLPGHYSDANLLNRFLTDPNCKETTFWFAPDDGADNVLLTDDDKSGAYYFGFTNAGSSYSCSNLPAHPHRMCIGGRNGSSNASNNPRVVAGTPQGWNPLGVPGSGPTPRTVTIDRAQTIDDDLSQSWANGNNAQTIDGQAAVYTPTACLFTLCISSDRAIRLRNWAPDVAKGPDNSLNAITIKVAHREDGNVNQPRVEIRTVSNESGSSTCPDVYTLPTNNTGGLQTHELLLGGSATAAAESVAQCLDSADKINGLELKFLWTGNVFNSGTPKIYLDGASISFQSTPGASFPLPEGDGVAAAQDCADERPGAQFIFGGDSHAYVNDGSLEICAGPYPNAPGDHQQIAVFGYPAVPPLRGTNVTPLSGGGYRSTTLTNSFVAGDIGEPGNPAAQGNDGPYVSQVRFTDTNDCSPTFVWGVNIGTYCAVTWDYQGGADVRLASYEQAKFPNLAVDKVTARIAYDADNAKALEFIETNDAGACRAWVVAKLVGTLGIGDLAGNVNCARSQVAFYAGGTLRCTRDLPLAGDLRSYDMDITGCVSQADLVNGVTARFIAKAQHVKFCFIGCIGEWGKSASPRLDGIEILVGLKQTGSVKAPVPQSGCIVDYPNYWEGAGEPGGDCAIIKADSLRPTNGIIPDWIVAEGADFIGRLSVRGTVYAPSAAYEIDDLDTAYSLATRGIVVRHLRVKGFRTRPGYLDPVIDSEIDDSPVAREATFVACHRADGREAVTSACDADAGDQILTRARVRFEYNSDTPDDWTPEVVWWTDQR